MSGNHGEILVQGPNAPLEIAPREEQGEIMGLVSRAMSDPTFDVDKLERLLAMHERSEAQRRKELFEDALLACQKEMPRVKKNGHIDPSGANIPYARLEDLDACIRPIYQAHGFTVRFDAPQSVDGGKIRTVGRFSCAGHTEPVEITAGASNRGSGRLSLTDAQKVKQTITECRRHVLEMFFSIITEGADEVKSEAISEDQARTLNDKIEEVKANKALFLKHFKIEKIAELDVERYGEAVRLLDAKRRG